VHGYWLPLRCAPLSRIAVPGRDRRAFDEHLTEENVAKELAYFTAPFRASFERPYGYGWLLALAQELKQSSLPQAAGWYQTLEPLTQDIRNRWWITSASSPIRSASGRTTTRRLPSRWRWITVAQWKISALEQAIVAAAERFYLADTRYPAHYEPGGDEYISGALTEALLMSKVLRTSRPGLTRFWRWAPLRR
jgi:hypothetical protein